MIWEVSEEVARELSRELPENPDVVDFFNKLVSENGDAVYVGWQFEPEHDTLHQVGYKFYAPSSENPGMWTARGVNPLRRELVSPPTHNPEVSPTLQRLIEAILTDFE